MPVDEAPKWVSNAVQSLHAERIGHGIHVLRDVAVTKKMAAEGRVRADGLVSPYRARAARVSVCVCVADRSVL